MKFKKTFFKKLLSTVALVCFILVVRVSVCWMNFISYIIAGNLTKTRFYIFIYVLWNINLLSSFTSLFSYVYSYFFSVFFFLKNFVKPKLFYQYLFESLRKQQLRGILLNMYFFILINFTKSCRLLATFFKTNKTFQHCLNIVVKVIWLCDVGQCWIKFETTLCMYTLKFTTLNNVKLTLSVSKLILTTLDNAETMLLVWTSSFTTSKERSVYDHFYKAEKSKILF